MNAPDGMPLAVAEFESHRHYLIGVAYRMLGSIDEGEDIVQDAYLRWHNAAQTTEIANLRPYLTRIVVRLCLDRLKSAQVRRETYVGPWLPEPVIAPSPLTSPAGSAELAEDLSFALLLTLERLSPLERAAFLLHDVFDMDFCEVAEALDRSEDACRQLASRARAHVRENRPRFAPSTEEHGSLVEVFMRASQSGDAKMLANLLAEDAVVLSDGGGRVPAAQRPVVGRDKVAIMFVKISQKFELYPQLRIVSASINGLPGVIFYDADVPAQTLSLETNEAGQISRIYVVRNPEKLRHIPPLAA